jgi:hypothetical protein
MPLQIPRDAHPEVSEKDTLCGLKSQTSTAAPAEPGELPFSLDYETPLLMRSQPPVVPREDFVSHHAHERKLHDGRL